jgi:hypothetical protein
LGALGAFAAATFFTTTGLLATALAALGFLLGAALLLALTITALGAVAFLAGAAALGFAAKLGVATGFAVFFDIFQS